MGTAAPDASEEDAQKAARLRARLAELLAQMEAKKTNQATRPIAPPVQAVTASKPEAPPVPVPTTPRATESLRRAEDQFRAGDFEAALRSLRGTEADPLTGENRVLVQYLTAGCLRHLDKLDEAAVLYRSVVESHGDEVLVENAGWQLKAIESRRNLMRELAALRERP